MEIQQFVRETYQDVVKQAQIPDELKNALKAHERIPVFVDNMAREIKALPYTVDKEVIRMAVRDLTLWFMQAATRQANERIMSDLEKWSLKQKEQDKAELRAAADALIAGENEIVTRDKDGNETARATVEV